MSVIRGTFDWAGELYSRWLGDFLHEVNFIIRIAILLLAAWLIIYVIAQLFRYIIAPLFLLFYYNVIFRPWNYITAETLEEVLYVRYYSKDKPNFRNLYLRTYDRVTKNRTILDNLSYKGMIRRCKYVTLGLMITSIAVATVWIPSFGLHQRDAELVMVQNGIDLIQGEVEADEDDLEYVDSRDIEIAIPDNDPVVGNWLSPTDWLDDAEITLRLNELGIPGARLRSGPGIIGQRVIEILWDDDQMVYLHSFTPDPDVPGLYWLRVLSSNGTEGYISSQVVEIVGGEST